jgi:hypothetical protein
LNAFHIHHRFTRGSTIKRKQRLVDKGNIPKENYLFPLMSNEEREKQRHGNKEKENMHEDRGSIGQRGSDGRKGRISAVP